LFASDGRGPLAAVAVLITLVSWAPLGCGLPSSEEVLAGKACDERGACAAGYECDPASQVCVPLGSLPGQGGAGGAGGHGGGGESAGGGGESAGGGGEGGSPQCASIGDCPTPVSPCETPLCLGGQCGSQPAPNGTPLPTQTPGDCALDVCDGFGNVTMQNDDGDMPDDGNECTAEQCNNGEVLSEPNAIGSMCSVGGIVCDGGGSCVACNAPSDCFMLPPNDDCQLRQCALGLCEQLFTPLDTPLGSQLAGDCQVVVCDGNGSMQGNVDDSDLPVDGRECTDDVCTNGSPSNPNKALGEACSAGTCDDAGNCTGCSVPSDCGSDSFCQQHTCSNTLCGTIDTAVGTPLPSQDQIAGDCNELRCNGSGGVVAVADDGDLPADDGNDCSAEICSGGVASHPNKPIDAVCATGGIVCDGSGSCVACNAPSQCAQGTVCQNATCSGNSCGFMNIANNSPAKPSGQIAGDCKVVLCDGVGATKAPAVDNADVPIDGNDCTYDVCTNGAPSNPSAPAGTSCQNGTGSCNGAGTCSTLAGLGAPCSVSGQCQSGTCIDGVCCNGSCNSLCEACSAALSGGANGSCAYIPIGQDPQDECAGAMVCTGAGACYTCNDHIFSHAWASDLQPNDTQTQRATALALDGSDNVIVVGYFSGAAVDFGGGAITGSGGEDIFVVKLDAAGNHVWSRGFGGGQNEQPLAVAVNANGDIAITGFYRSSNLDFGGGNLAAGSVADRAFIVKLDAGGNHLWGNGYTSAGDLRGTSVAIDNGGEVFAAGRYAGSINLGGGAIANNGGADIFVVRLASANGAHVWSDGHGGASDQIPNALALDGAGNLVVVGQWQTSLDFGGGALTNMGNNDAFVAKLAGSSGGHLWSKSYGSSSEQAAKGVAVDGAGAVIITGEFQNTINFGGATLTSASGTYDVFLAKLDGAGVHQWSKRFGNVDNQHGKSVAVDNQNEILLGGDLQGSADFGGGPRTASGSFDVFVAKFSPTGAYICSQVFGDGSEDRLTAVALDSSRNALLAGYFFGSLSFGGANHTTQNATASDAFVAKRTP
jgi:hypothetical protein